MNIRGVDRTGVDKMGTAAKKSKSPERRCPVCEQMFRRKTSESMPFCSLRCQQIDLGRWLDERHSVPEPLSLDPDEFPEEEPPANW
jgi:endogenous inhibitor of DNA gyrase (YacG/DUF329 family)